MKHLQCHIHMLFSTHPLTFSSSNGTHFGHKSIENICKRWIYIPIIDPWSSHHDKCDHSWGSSSKHTKQSSKAHTSSHTPAGECRPPCYCLVSLLGFDSIWHVTCTRWHSYIITQHYTLFYTTHHTLLGSYTIGHVWGTRPTRWHPMQTQYKGLIIQTRASGAFIILWAIKEVNVTQNRTMSYLIDFSLLCDIVLLKRIHCSNGIAYCIPFWANLVYVAKSCLVCRSYKWSRRMSHQNLLRKDPEQICSLGLQLEWAILNKLGQSWWHSCLEHKCSPPW